MKLPIFISSISSVIKFLGALAAVAVLATAAQAQVIVSNFVITTSSLSFDLSGTLTGTFSGSAVQLRLLPEQSVNFVSAQNQFVTPDSSSTLTIGNATLYRVDTYPNLGIVMFFNASMATGDAISGSVLVNFPADTFQNLNGTTFRLERGYGGEDTKIQATGIGAAAVPEPSTYAAIAGALALVGTIVVRRRGTSRVG